MQRGFFFKTNKNCLFYFSRLEMVDDFLHITLMWNVTRIVVFSFVLRYLWYLLYLLGLIALLLSIDIHIIVWKHVILWKFMVLIQGSCFIKVFFLARNLFNESLAVQIILWLASSLGLNIGGLFLNKHILISEASTFSGVDRTIVIVFFSKQNAGDCSTVTSRVFIS